MSSNLKVNSLVPATGTAIGIGTTGGSIDFRCPATFGGNVTIGGTLTYDEVINIDSIGIVTARTGLHAKDDSTFYGVTSGRNVVWDKSENSLEFGDYTYAKFGVDEDLSIFSQNTLSVINNKTGELRIPSAGNVRILKRHDGSGAFAGELANFKVDGAVELFNAGSKKFETTSSGVTVTGQGVFSAAITASTYIQGTSSNGGLKFYSDSSASRGVTLNTDDHLIPSHDSNSDLGLTGTRWRNVYADTLYGDGSNLTGITGTTINNNANNRLITGSGTANTLEGEANLTYDGSTLAVTGDVTMTNTSSNPQLALISANNGISEIQFGDGADAVRGNIIYRAGTAGDALCFNGYNNTERMRIDSSGRMGLGTNAPDGYDNEAKNFVVASADHTGITIASTGSNKRNNLYFADGTSGNAAYRGAFTYDHASDYMMMRTAGIERFRIDNTGALGLGITPKNNGGNYRQLQIGLGAHFYGRTDDTPIYISSNAYYDGSNWKYTANTTVSHIAMGTNIVFSNAASGTAGNTVSLTERLRIDSSGNLSLGTSPSIQKFTIDGGGISIDNGWNVQWGVNASRAYIQGEDENGNDRLILGTSNTERLRIDGNGKVIVAHGQVHASRVLARFGIDCQGMDIYDGVGVVANYGMAFYNDPTSNKANGIGFFNDDGQTCGGYIVHQDKGGSNIGDLIFATAAVANTPVERLRLTSGGQLIQYTTHTTGNSAHGNTSWYGDDASQYTIEIRDFNEMYAVKTVNTNSYDHIIYKREKMTSYCDIEFTMQSAHDSSGSGYMHLGMVINGDGSDTHSNFDRLVFRSNGGNTSTNQIRLDKGGGGSAFSTATSNFPTFHDGTERHYQIKIRGRRFAIYINGAEVHVGYTNINLRRTHGFFGFEIYEQSSLNPWIKIRDFKITNHTPSTGVPGWEVVFDTPASTNASSSFVIDNMDNPQTVEMRFWRLRHSGGNTNSYFRLGWQGSWQTSGYHDIAQYHNEGGSWTASRGHNQGQGQPFHYDFTGSTNYYSGVMTIRRVSSGGNNTGFVYNSNLVVDYDSGNTQYHIVNNGRVQFGNTNPWTKIQLYTNSGTNFNYGSMQVLAQY